jgi:predicted MFS family arabinose efflux permease
LFPRRSADDGRTYALVAGLGRLAQGLAMLSLSLTAALIPAAGFFWLVYLTSGISLSPHAALVNAEIPAERRSTLLSIQSLAFYAGSFAGGAILGRVADQWGIPAAWAIGGALLLASTLPYVLLNTDRFKTRKEVGHDFSIRSMSSGS